LTTHSEENSIVKSILNVLVSVRDRKKRKQNLKVS